MTATHCQRWHGRTDSYRPAGEPIEVSRYGVELIDSDRLASDFVKRHHYSGSYPAARCRVGLYRTGRASERAQLVGVAVFSVPMQPRALDKWCGTRDAVELGRLVLLDDVEANGETWFLSRAFRLLVEAKPEVRAVLSYSDPTPRSTASGRIVIPGHVGTIYQAHNGRHVGLSSKRILILDADGEVVSGRALTKIRKGERGAGPAYDRLIAMGAPVIRRGESPKAWVSRALAEGPFRKLRHEGNLAYVWPVGSAPKRTRRKFPDALPYVKRDPEHNQFSMFGTLERQ